MRRRSLRVSQNSMNKILQANFVYADPDSRAVCYCSLARFAASNPAGDMGVYLFWVLHFVRQRSLRRADLSSRGVLTSVCLSMSENRCNKTLYTCSKQVEEIRLRKKKNICSEITAYFYTYKNELTHLSPANSEIARKWVTVTSTLRIELHVFFSTIPCVSSFISSEFELQCRQQISDREKNFFYFLAYSLVTSVKKSDKGKSLN